MTKFIASRAGRKATTKPAKPYSGFPLYAHASGRWAKKIRGKLHYFGAWDDSDAALAKYLDVRDDLHAGRTPHPKRAGLTVRELCNRFLAAKEAAKDAGELAPVTWSDYFQICKYLVEPTLRRKAPKATSVRCRGRSHERRDGRLVAVS